MSILTDLREWFNTDPGLRFIIGVSGAAAMAATDFRSWKRVVQHTIVGVLASMWATPIFAPAITKILGLFTVDVDDQYNGAVFLTGAFAVYVFEFVKELASVRKQAMLKKAKEALDIDDSDKKDS